MPPWSTSASATRYELEELTGSVLPWVPQTTTLTGTSWTPPTPRPNGHYDYRVRGCNVYGCGAYNLATVPGSVDVQIPTGSPMTVPANFSAIPTDVVAGNKAKFYWDPVSGADTYHLRQEDLFCGSNQIPPFNVAANTAMPYKLGMTIPLCNGQPRTSATYDFDIQACAGSVCSEWSETIRVTVTSGANPNSTASTVTTTTYIHTDALRSASVETNALGAVLSRTNYEPYGKVLGTANQGPGYAGHVTDATTGLSYMQQRYYDPIGGRFLSIDPVAADPNSGANFNRYWYANNNPYRFIDPDGRKTYDCTEQASCTGEIKIKDLKQGDVVKTNGATLSVGKKDITVKLNKGFEDGGSAAYAGPRLIPKSPPGVSTKSNSDEASKMSAFEFRDAVKNKGKWDYKQQGSEYEPYGNFNYGVTGRSVGFPPIILLQEAGRAQSAAGTSLPAWGSPGALGQPWTGSGSFGDDPVDQFWIQQGIRKYDSGTDL